MASAVLDYRADVHREHVDGSTSNNYLVSDHLTESSRLGEDFGKLQRPEVAYHTNVYVLGIEGFGVHHRGYRPIKHKVLIPS